MPSPLKNAKIGRNTTEFEPSRIPALRVRFNRSLPPSIETIADILADPEALRSLDLLEGEPNYDQAFVDSLAALQTTPALVRPLPPNKEFWEVFAGCRRATAICLINARAEAEARTASESIPRGLSLIAFRHDVNDKEAFKLALHENLQSKELTVLDKARWAKNSERFGFSRAEAAHELGVSVGALSHWLSLLAAPHRMQELVISEIMPQDIALHALSSMSEAEMDRLCERFEEGATHPEPSAAKAIKSAAKQSAKTAKRTSGGKLSRTLSEIRHEAKATGIDQTDMGKRWLAYMAGEIDIEDIGCCNFGDVYVAPEMPDANADSNDSGNSAYELRDGRAVPIGA